jgi:hypothetical protein
MKEILKYFRRKIYFTFNKGEPRPDYKMFGKYEMGLMQQSAAEMKIITFFYRLLIFSALGLSIYYIINTL